MNQVSIPSCTIPKLRQCWNIDQTTDTALIAIVWSQMTPPSSLDCASVVVAKFPVGEKWMPGRGYPCVCPLPSRR